MKNIFEYTDLLNDQVINAQVCIIGSGCGGATTAALLAKQAIDVIILEQGGYYPSKTFDNRELNMAGKISAQRNFESTEDGAINLLHGNNVGGASVHYWADSYRTPQDRLELWASEYGIKDHDINDLTPAWDELDKTLHVHEASEDFYNPMNKLVRSASKKLKWHGKPVPQARKFCQKSGHCMQGCVFDAKQSQLITHIPNMLSNGGRLYADVKAKKLIVKEGTVVGLEAAVIDRRINQESGVKLTINADVFVVAAGGFSSSAFLLNNGFKSKLPALGEGVAMNPSPMVHALYSHDITQWRNIPAAYGIDEFRLARYDKDTYREGGFMLMPNQLHPAMIASSLPGIGREHQELMKNVNKIGGTIGWIDDPFDELGTISVDKNGKRIVSYPMKFKTQAMLKDLIRKQIELNFSAGAERVYLGSSKPFIFESMKDINKLDDFDIYPGQLIMGAPHPSGGCRMGENKKTSVVDSTHRVHGFDNLFVSDSSVFPTGVSVDPSYTIMAFSYVASRNIQDQLKNTRSPLY